IASDDDGIHADGLIQIDGGNMTITAHEGIEGTYVLINGGMISINASDDGINAGQKSNLYTPTVEINGGYITIVMGQGDTDAIDVNGYLYINGGTVDITAQFPFDYDRGAEHNGGTIIVNGEETNEITNQFGGMGGGPFSPGENGPFSPGDGEGFPNDTDFPEGGNPGEGGHFPPGGGPKR
ncbi:MAG: carbohydrate-binding domain-containing protein, partial [Erysipelotrichaceae bacterium]|nr:carbohydrate-binding domain-containing protein [Erysipelotrichaceae bacterium]